MMKILRCIVPLLCIGCMGLFQAIAFAGLTPKQTQLAAGHIDSLLAAHWKAHNITGNAPISDEVFLRRIYLDLAGRIPTGAESVAFLDSKVPDKRATLIDSLLGRESYVAHFYNLWADVLRYKSQYVNRANVIEAAYAAFIKESLRVNKPYDQFVRELLSAEGYAWENGAIGYYHRDPDMPLDNMAITTRIFLGTRTECAQCHDHPFDKWKQTDFYHLAAFTHANKSLNEAFDKQGAAMRAREKAIDALYQKERATSRDGGKEAAERKKERMAGLDNRGVAGLVKGPVGQLFSPIGLKRNPAAVLKLPGDFEELDGNPGDVMKPMPLFGPVAEISPGQDLAVTFANWLTSPENPRFTRVIVNRLWKRMFGVPLTESFDDLRDQSKAMVPEVEAYLEKLMIALKYDMRAFLAVVARTRAYQSAVAREEFKPGEVFHFQGPLLRRMSAEQIWDSLVTLGSYEPDARDEQRMEREDRRIQVSKMAFDAYVNFDGEKLLAMALERLEKQRELAARELAVREATVVAKRDGDHAKARELGSQQSRLTRERGEVFVREFIMPLLTHLAQIKGGKSAEPMAYPGYQIHPNPNILATETWKAMYVPGYGPVPKTPAQWDVAAQADKQRMVKHAAQMGIPEKDHAAFLAYCDAARKEWLRASELDSPAPRGHLLRTMGQSDREFVENANPNASIPQALLLMNSDVCSPKGLLSPYSPLMQSVSRARTVADKVDAAYMALLSRRPTADERSIWNAASTGGLSSIEDLIYALLNTKQFLFVQ